MRGQIYPEVLDHTLRRVEDGETLGDQHLHVPIGAEVLIETGDVLGLVSTDVAVEVAMTAGRQPRQIVKLTADSGVL